MSHLSRAAVVLILLTGAKAQAGNYGVDPIQLELGSQRPSAVLTLTNSGKEPLRFQLSASLWDERRAGGIELKPTSDVIVFPSLITLQPGHAAKVRVGTTAPADLHERTYRVIVDELPPLVKDAAGGAQTGVKVLTRTSIPIFVFAGVAKPMPRLDAARVDKGTISFTVANGGNAHMRVSKVHVEARGADNQVRYEQDVAGWYVLANGVRDYSFPIPANVCSDVRTVAVRIEADRGKAETTVGTGPEHCSR